MIYHKVEFSYDRNEKTTNLRNSMMVILALQMFLIQLFLYLIYKRPYTRYTVFDLIFGLLNNVKSYFNDDLHAAIVMV
ncbi:MAG: hypothetical protein H6Q49_1112 [Deltaproteobacteria bacterium]|nr:hypothetical protein [Deltaproteobacteria bacterium]